MRTIRIGEYEFFGSERQQWESIEAVLIARLEREHGPNHRLVHEARRRGQELEEAALEELARTMRSFSLFREADVPWGFR
jgi:hypothetical protein